MGDIAAYLKDEKLTIDEIKLTPLELSEMIASIKNGIISGKIAKEVTKLLFGCYAFWTYIIYKASYIQDFYVICSPFILIVLLLLHLFCRPKLEL